MPILVEGFHHPSICRAYLEGPCKCCGLPHALLKQTQIEGGGLELEYNCPLAVQENIVGHWRYEIRMMKNDICPDRLTRYCEYNTGKVLTMIKMYTQSETGKRKNKRMIDALRRKSASICYRKKVERDMNEGQRKGTLFIEPPCNCCGSDDHGLLKHIENLDGNNITKYNCPIALHEDWDDARKLADSGSKYYPCPTKLAHANNHLTYKVEQAVNMIRDKGAGIYLGKKNLESLMNISLHLCLSYQEERQRELAKIIGLSSLGLCLCLMILSTMSPIGPHL